MLFETNETNETNEQRNLEGNTSDIGEYSS